MTIWTIEQVVASVAIGTNMIDSMRAREKYWGELVMLDAMSTTSHSTNAVSRTEIKGR